MRWSGLLLKVIELSCMMGDYLERDKRMRLKEKVAVVTGGGNGIGRAICLAFAGEGAAVAVTDIDALAAKRVTDEIVRQGGRAISIKMDVTNTSDVTPRC